MTPRGQALYLLGTLPANPHSHSVLVGARQIMVSLESEILLFTVQSRGVPSLGALVPLL